MRDQDKIAPLHVAAIRKGIQECVEFALGRRRGAQETDAPHRAGLLCENGDRPRRCCAADLREEFATKREAILDRELKVQGFVNLLCAALE